MNLKKYFLLMISCGLSACATTQTASIPINVPPIIEKSTTVIPKLPTKKAFLNAQGDAISQAVTSYEKTGKAVMITTSQRVRYPFAHSTPTIVCSPLQVCEIVLAANEKITGVYPGDTSRWLFEVAHSGMDDDQQSHVIFKPKFSDIITNAIITTDQRTYHALRAMERRSRGRVVCGRLRFANQPAGMCSKSLCSRKAICGSCVCLTHTVVLRRTS